MKVEFLKRAKKNQLKNQKFWRDGPDTLVGVVWLKGCANNKGDRARFKIAEK